MGNYSELCDALARAAGTVGTDGMWDESKHPRKGGKFAPKGSEERFSKADAVAVHEATAKANWEAMHPSAGSDTPNSDLMKGATKLNTLLKVGRIVKPGSLIKGSGLGTTHREEFKKADRMDRHPEYGPSGAKREEVGWEVRTHPFHQGVVEAFQDIQNQADRLSASGNKQEQHAPSKYAREMYARQAADPNHGTHVVSSATGVPHHEVHSSSVREAQWDAKARAAAGGRPATVQRSRRTGLVSHSSDWTRVGLGQLKGINPKLPR